MSKYETGWLIEIQRDGRAVWWAARHLGRHGVTWTTNASEAVRFARKVDAERVRDWVLETHGAIVTEHGWCPPPDWLCMCDTDHDGPCATRPVPR